MSTDTERVSLSSSDSSVLDTDGGLRDNLLPLQDATLRNLLLAVGAFLWFTIVPYSLNAERFWPGWGVNLGLLVVVAGCYWVRFCSFSLSSLAFVASLLIAITVRMSLVSDFPTAYFFVPVILIAGTIQRPRVAFAAAIYATLVILIRMHALPPSNPNWVESVLIIVWSTTFTAWLGTRNLYTMLRWLLHSERQASTRLIEVQKHRGELAATLRQLTEATYRLERANYALAWAREEADKARRLKSEFAAHVSHELRTPLNLIVGFSDVMLRTPQVYGGDHLPQPYVADLTALHRSAKQLQSLIDDILDLSQLDAGEMPLFKEWTDVAMVIDEAVATVKQLFDRKGLWIKIDVENGLPLIFLDRLRIRQVFLNLLSNAAHHTDIGGVSIEMVQSESAVVIHVADTGEGIDPSYLPHLFEQFHHFEKPGPNRAIREGWGLGLAISRKFVELHGGTIVARNIGAPGQGAVFEVSLPLRTVATVNIPSVNGGAILRSVQTLQTVPPSARVIVVSPDTTVIRSLQRHLRDYQVVGASTDEDALRIAQQACPHAIVTNLPNVEERADWERHWIGRARNINLRIIGFPMPPSSHQRADIAGLADYLVKPVSRETLIQVVHCAAPSAHRILVVDDDPQVVRLFCRMLQSANRSWDLLRAYDGAGALEIVHSSPPDIVLLDLYMPKVDGLTVAEKMRCDANLAHIPIVAVSAKGIADTNAPVDGNQLVLLSGASMTLKEMIDGMRSLLNTLPPAEVLPT